MTTTGSLAERFAAAARVEAPDGMVLGWRVCHRDLRSRDGYRWPWPGEWATDPREGVDLDPKTAPDDACPSHRLGGVCIAKTAQGAASGGIPLGTVLVTAHHPTDVLGEDHNKLRVARALVLDVVDVASAATAGNLQGADLRGAYLRGANLRGAYLRGANLQDAYLRGANLQDANLWGANLQGAYLWGANLQGAHLWGANLQGAHLWGANLQDADLQGANLRGANLWGANLQGADLRGADLQGADLRGAYLWGANLQDAYLRGAEASPGTVWPVGFDPGKAGVR